MKNLQTPFRTTLKRLQKATNHIWFFTAAWLLAAATVNQVQAFDFSTSTLEGADVSLPTCLQFGPDGRLYIGQLDGIIKSYSIERSSPNSYQASDEEIITLIATMPNYDDDGTPNPSVNGRQLTGLLVTGSSSNPVIYIASSDPRGGAGSGGENDSNLDTNSSIISRLTANGSSWEKVDLVRGLPRSEENHSANGIQIDPFTNMLYLAQGGNTNAGSPSVNFAFACETALSAAILSIDLTAINEMTEKTDAFGQTYLYDLPTLNDPNLTRAHNTDGSDLYDPFGGNDGLNQAKLVLGGPVQVHASGFRSTYDLLITQAPGQEGRLYAFDNAGNDGWGGYPMNEGPEGDVTNEYQPTEPGEVNNLDNLHFIDSTGYYGGHPNPIRANPAGAGWFHFDNELSEDGDSTTDPMVYSASPTSDWPPVPVSMANPIEGDFRMPGVDNGALLTNSASSNGMAEYLGSNFNGEMLGNIVVASFDGTVLRIELSEDGTTVTNGFEYLASGLNNLPLDIEAPFGNLGGDFAGTIWVSHLLLEDNITILEPADFDSPSSIVCTGINSFDFDEDNDGFSNADEILNDSNPCSGALLPPDSDGDFVSDILDQDDDNDGIADHLDPFPIDQSNGASTPHPHIKDLFNEPGATFFDVGMTGIMKNDGDEYLDLYDPDNFIAGGTAGLFTIASVDAGTATGNSNNQLNAFNFGITSNQYMDPYEIRVGISGPFFGGAPQGDQSHGIYIGTGDQDNYIKLAVNANLGNGGIEVVHEEYGNILSNTISTESGILNSNYIELFFDIDPQSGTIQAKYRLEGSETIIPVGDQLLASGDLMHSLMSDPPLAIGLIATTGNPTTPSFTATWDVFEIQPIASSSAAYFQIDPPQNTLLEASTYSDESFYIENLSTDGQLIEKVVIDLSTALYPDNVFDVNGQAGDPVTKVFTPDSDSDAGAVTHAYLDPNNGVDANDGYNGLEINFTEFQPSDFFSFSIDIDPTSVKGVAAPGENHSASVSGLELTGSTVSIYFSDGSVQKTSLSHISGDIDACDGYLMNGKPLQPTIQHIDAMSPVTSNDPQTIRVSGPEGSQVSLYHTDGGLYTEGAVNGGYNIEPLEANTVVYFFDFDAVIGSDGYVDISVPLSAQDEKSGINRLQAVLIDVNGIKGPTSPPLIIEYEPSLATEADVRVNAGGATYLDTLGNIWYSDYGFNNGGSFQTSNEIDGTEDDSIYQSERYYEVGSPNLEYSFDLPNNEYTVNLHFAEIFEGTMAEGARVFSVEIEGSPVAEDIDIFQAVGGENAYILSFSTTVSDEQLNIEFIQGVESPKISGIEVIAMGPPDLEIPTDPTDISADTVSYNEVTLSWTASTDNVGPVTYLIYRDQILIDTTIETTFSDIGLLPETIYAYEIYASDPSANLSEFISIEVTTTELPLDSTAPTAPGSVTIDSTSMSTISISWAASTDDTGIASYEIYRDGSLVSAVSGITTEFEDTGLTLSTAYNYQIYAIDLANNASPPASISATTESYPDLRINTGGNEYTDSLGRIWSADFGFNTGSTFEVSSEITGTENDSIYQSERYDLSSSPELEYALDVPNSRYLVNLHFAEIFVGTMFENARVFSVSVEGVLEAENIDIFEAVGPETAYVVSIPTTVTDEQLNVEFIHGIESPKISGIEVIDLGPPDAEVPTDPTDLLADAISFDSVTLSWTGSTDNLGSVSYLVYRDQVLVGSTESLTFEDQGLEPETNYNYEIFATDPSDNLSNAVVLQVTTSELPLDTTPPSQPSPLVAVSSTTSTITLSWATSTDNTGISRYDIHRDGFPLTSVSGLTTTYVDSTLTLGTDYLYEVYAIDLAENLSPSASLIASTTSQPDIRINAGGGEYTDTFGNIWMADTAFNTGNTFASTNEISGTEDDAIYQSERFDFSGDPNLEYNIDLANGQYQVNLHFAEIYEGAQFEGGRVFSLNIEDTLVQENVDIFKAVGANTAYVVSFDTIVTDEQLNIQMIEGFENPKISGIEITVQGPPDNEAPTSPSGFAASSIGYNFADLTWIESTDNIGVSVYLIYRDQLLVETTSELNLQDLGLSPNSTYTYEIYARDSSENISAAASLSVTTLELPLDTTPPSSPGDLKIVSTSTSSIALSWSPSTDDIGIANYQISRDGTPIGTVSGLATEFEDTGLEQETAYSYNVYAEDLAGNTSTIVSVAGATETQIDLRINAGGNEYTDTFGNIWSADYGFNTGNTFEISTDISGTEDDTVYQSERFDFNGLPELEYSFEVANGEYVVNLHFAEIYVGTMSSGARVFSVNIEGNLEAENLDIFDSVGAESAAIISLPVSISDGEINITLLQGIENPKISGIEILVATNTTPSSGSQLLAPVSAPSLSTNTDSRMANLSTRAEAGTDADVIIAGFVIEGTQAKQLLIRGIGPSLKSFGLDNSLQSPVLTVFQGDTVIESNAGWAKSANQTVIQDISNQLGAFNIEESSNDAALLLTLEPGTYTAVLQGANATTGLAMVEVYEVDQSESRLINLSTRARVGTGASIAIPGVVISGSETSTLLIRAVGPGLQKLGITEFLKNPVLQVLDQDGKLVAKNAKWSASKDLTAISNATAKVGAFSLEDNSLDAALLIELAPGAYTVFVSGENDTTGIALIELYELRK
ncbi:malectin domain-containing carbohydrate-binding protein [Puniceicoccaceae bacterium K14]|nr:malectin domain-containing carbohydrate-binding protein [Puniceicoccaceae bacterium K14]